MKKRNVSKNDRKVNYRKIKGGHDLFSVELRVNRLKKLNHPLNKLSENIDFELFRTTLQKYCDYRGGAPWDKVLMFKATLL